MIGPSGCRMLNAEYDALNVERDGAARQCPLEWQ
jgi:hypothetical protein